MTDIVPRQREFKANMALINETLNGLIAKAQKFEGTEDLEELQNRDYSKVNDPSLLRLPGGHQRRGRHGHATAGRPHDDAHRRPRDHRRGAHLVPLLFGAG
jgi:hypothetical protein